MSYEKIAFIANGTDRATSAKKRLAHVYGNYPVAEADVIVALGGDGFMLNTLEKFMDIDTPIYGLNRGSIGFLMNEFKEENLIERLSQAEMARRLGLSSSGAKSRVQRGRALLRKVISGCCNVQTDRRGNILEHDCTGPCC